LHALLPRPAYALAVSGGPDSMSLLALAAAARRLTPAPHFPHVPHFTVLHVHHGLAAEADEWAQRVERAARRADMPAEILFWRGAKPAHGLAAAARTARYALLRAACQARGLDGLVLAHHMEDQAETVLMRLERGSQLGGLAAMAARRSDGGVWLLRPFLHWRQAQLHRCQNPAYGRAVSDGANRDQRFARARLRAMAPALAAHGLTPPRLTRLAQVMERVQHVWDNSARRARQRLCRQDVCGWRIERAGFAALPPLLAQHLLRHLLRAPCPRAPRDFYAVRTRQLAALQQNLCAGRRIGFSLGGFLLRLRAREILLYREFAQVRRLPPLAVRAGTSVVWDGRVRLMPRLMPRMSGEIAALGAEGVRCLRTMGAALPPWPVAAVMSSPGLWQNGRLRASPFHPPPHDLPHALVFAPPNPYIYEAGKIHEGGHSRRALKSFLEIA